MKSALNKIIGFKVILSLYLTIWLVYSTPTIKTIQAQYIDNVQLTQGSISDDNVKIFEETIPIGKKFNLSVSNVNETHSISDTFSSQKKFVCMSGISNIFPLNRGGIQLESKLNVTISEKVKCPTLNGAESLTQTQLINILTASCRYDRLERPGRDLDTRPPVNIYVRMFINFFQYLAPGDLCFRIQGLLQLRYIDPRLDYGNYTARRDQPLLGKVELRDLIWVPHISLTNEQDSNILEASEKNILTSIQSDGTVLLSTKIQTTVYCSTNWKKFPFDKQECSLDLESWMYNTSDLLLSWEQISPVTFDTKIRFSEYDVENYWSKENIIYADINNVRRGLYVGNFSSLNLTIILTREVGCYVMNYFLPSMMIVAISWVSFWLQPDQTPARTTLGTSTMLSFLTLASSQHKNLPTINNVKLSEVWYLGCTFFIFGSLIEFAFVNTIWRRKKTIELEKVNSKYIFKSTLTPTIRRRIAIESRPNLYKRKFKNNTVSENCSNISANTSPSNKEGNIISSGHKLKMTPHQVSLWIDRKSRFLFPLAFIIFNAIFWTLTYSL